MTNSLNKQHLNTLLCAFCWHLDLLKLERIYTLLIRLPSLTTSPTQTETISHHSHKGHDRWNIPHGCSCPSRAVLQMPWLPTWRYQSSTRRWLRWISCMQWPLGRSSGWGFYLPDRKETSIKPILNVKCENVWGREKNNTSDWTLERGGTVNNLSFCYQTKKKSVRVFGFWLAVGLTLVV